MNLNINNKDFVDQIKGSIFNLLYCNSTDRSFPTNIGINVKLRLKDKTDIYRFGYSIVNISQFKFLIGTEYEDIKNDLRYWTNKSTCHKPEVPFINENNEIPAGYFFVFDGLLFYKPKGFNPTNLYICADKNGKIFGTDLEVKDFENKI